MAVLLFIGGIVLLVTGYWILADGLNGIVIDHTNPYVHFGETTVAQEITDGIIELFFGALCLVILIVLFFTRRKLLFPSKENK